MLKATFITCHLPSSKAPCLKAAAAVPATKQRSIRSSRGVAPVNQCGRLRAERFPREAAVFVADPILRTRATAAVTLQEPRSEKRLRSLRSVVGSSGDNCSNPRRSCSSVIVSTVVSTAWLSRPRTRRSTTGARGAAAASGSSISTCSWRTCDDPLPCMRTRSPLPNLAQPSAASVLARLLPQVRLSYDRQLTQFPTESIFLQRCVKTAIPVVRAGAS
jgi:hypothetical protein